MEVQLEEEIVPANDAAGMAAFLRLLAAVLRSAEEGERGERIRFLEAKAGLGSSPMWELLFQLMCFPVPQVGGARKWAMTDLLPCSCGSCCPSSCASQCPR